jgi:16S rRNA (uracil1498-N3)-methyltransferase
VVTVEKKRIELRLLGDPLPDKLAPLVLTLATAMPKGERVDWLVEKACELGVSRLQPILTSRSVVDPGSGKLDRLRRGVIEACKQCGRNRLMEIKSPIAWGDLLSEGTEAIGLVAHPGGASFENWPENSEGTSVTLAIGPEGGFSEAEIDAAVVLGWTLVSLGATILRIETAGLAGICRLMAIAESAQVH